MERKTKIIATLGPAVASRDAIFQLVAAGMDVARLNFSHGGYDQHREFLKWVHEASLVHGRAVAVLQDIQGPKIRVGRFPGGAIEIEEGDQVTLRSGSGTAGPGEINIEYLDSVVGLKPGDIILLADGLMRLEVQGIGAGVSAVVRQGGVLKDRKGAAFPGAMIDVPAITDKDRQDLEFGAEIGVDMVAASFVATAGDIREVRRLTDNVMVIAKIERTVGYQGLDEILDEADGAMVARGDLGVELRIEALPRVQKEIIARTNARGRISITATEMLESMTGSPRPTRAEATDVANAVLDGSDAVMLSAETAVGRFPIRAVEVMDAICREAEAGPRHQERMPVGFLRAELPFPSAITKAAVEVARNLDIETIVGFTESGATARLLSKYRPGSRIVAFTANDRTYRQMALLWGVVPHSFERRDHTDQMLDEAEEILVGEGIARPGEGVVMVAGIPPNQGSYTNLLKVHELGAETGGVPGGR